MQRSLRRETQAERLVFNQIVRNTQQNQVQELSTGNPDNHPETQDQSLGLNEDLIIEAQYVPNILSIEGNNNNKDCDENVHNKQDEEQDYIEQKQDKQQGYIKEEQDKEQEYVKEEQDKELEDLFVEQYNNIKQDEIVAKTQETNAITMIPIMKLESCRAPILEKNVTVQLMSMKIQVIKSALQLYVSAKFMTTVKPKYLPAKELNDNRHRQHTTKQKEAIMRHAITVYHLVIKFQNKLTLINYINQSKDDNWPGGRT